MRASNVIYDKFPQLLSRLFSPGHHGGVADLQVAVNLTKVEPLGVHPDGQGTHLFGITGLLFLWRVPRTAYTAAIALTTGIRETSFILLVFIFAIWTSHAFILIEHH